jgi:uncharacterized protein (TIGR03435 family)
MRLRILVVLLWMLVAGNGIAEAQGAGKSAPAFEVASVRISPPGGDGMTSFSGVGTTRFTATNVTLPLLLQLAFGVEEYQVEGLPKWAESTSYDVSAKPEGDQKLTYEELKPMLQQLLVQRFHLTVHRWSKQFKGYALLVGKGGVRMPVSPGAVMVQAYILPNGLRAAAIDMDGLASMLGHATGRPVANKTGVHGRFDLKLDFAPAGGTGTDADGGLPSLFTAVQEQLGLRLEVQMVPVEMLTVDSVERIPTEN